ncbi:cell division protein FtsX [Planomonospora sphaerica]|uniref:Cell division protein FtsX n=1 Tax=Planomonospora sphaerica TaxID=161355 RepID=A0A161LNH6_9ACTN|nr:permease-like cell division protein FtsX [Planomonospora sphaerica]GAT69255.1 cell division protein FtsX [Planomonospora sphaerica]
MTATGDRPSEWGPAPAAGNRAFEQDPAAVVGDHPFEEGSTSVTGDRTSEEGPMSVVEERLRDALAGAAATASEVRPLPAAPARRRIRIPSSLAVPVRRRAGIPVLLAAVATAAAVAVAAFTAARVALPGPTGPELTKEHIIAMAMAGAAPERTGMAHISVFLCKAHDPFPQCAGDGVTETGKEEIRRTLDALPEVEAVVFEDRRTAYANFRAQNRENTVLMSAIQVEDMPESFRVWIVDPADRRMSEKVRGAVAGLPGISNVVDSFCLLHSGGC